MDTYPAAFAPDAPPLPPGMAVVLGSVVNNRYQSGDDAETLRRLACEMRASMTESDSGAFTDAVEMCGLWLEPTVDRTTAIGTSVLADVADYPRGYAWGEPRSEVKVRGTIYMIERDAGLGWCLVRLDDPGDGPAYMHVPMDRTTIVQGTES
jgi:hypothetical protein